MIAGNVVLNSSGNFGGRGIDALKDWASNLKSKMNARIDLLDEHEALDPRERHGG